MTVAKDWKELKKIADKDLSDSIDAVETYFPSPKGSKHLAELPNPLPKFTKPLMKEYLAPSDFAITQLPVTDLLAKIASGELKAVEVAGAYIRAGVLAHRLTNCANEFLPKEAYEMAKACDDYLAANGKTIGPFHGLPISVKEMVPIKNHKCNYGFTATIKDEVVEEQPSLCQGLADNGAVFFVRTTQPQTLMHIETDSYVHGVTTNPYNSDLTSGGSSGGEGAIIGMGASPMGIGTDIGGSIRVPSGNCGIYGLKPTVGRLSSMGFQNHMAGAEAILATSGPMTTSVEAIDLFMKAMVEDQYKRDIKMPPVPWRDAPIAPKSKITIGYLLDDGVVKPHPPVIRTIKEVAEKLKNFKGDYEIEVKEFKPWKHDEAWKIISTLYYADGGKEDLETMAASGEPVRELTKWIHSQSAGELTQAQLWEWNTKKYDYQYAYHKYWKDSGIDVLICPITPGAAPPHNGSKYWGYSAQWNLLDYPGLIMPASTVKQDVDVKEEGYEPRNESDKFVYSLYDSPKTYENAPISIQIVAPSYEDELVVQAAKIIDAAIKS